MPSGPLGETRLPIEAISNALDRNQRDDYHQNGAPGNPDRSSFGARIRRSVCEFDTDDMVRTSFRRAGVRFRGS